MPMDARSWLSAGDGSVATGSSVNRDCCLSELLNGSQALPRGESPEAIHSGQSRGMVNLGTALGVVLANCPQTVDRRDAEVPRSVVSPRQKA